MYYMPGDDRFCTMRQTQACQITTLFPPNDTCKIILYLNTDYTLKNDVKKKFGDQYYGRACNEANFRLEEKALEKTSYSIFLLFFLA